MLTKHKQKVQQNRKERNRRRRHISRSAPGRGSSRFLFVDNPFTLGLALPLLLASK